jgi:hypothetical protein
VGAGRTALEWNGRDDAGRAVPGGIYWIRVRSEREAQVRKVIIRP